MHVNVPSNAHMITAVQTRCKFIILLRGMPIWNKNLVPWWSNWRPKAHVTSQARTPNITNVYATGSLPFFWMQRFVIGNTGITCHHWNVLPQCNNPTLWSVHFFLQKSTSKIQTARPSCVAKCCLKHKRNCVVAEYPCGLAVFGMRTVLDVGTAPPLPHQPYRHPHRRSAAAYRGPKPDHVQWWKS